MLSNNTIVVTGTLKSFSRDSIKEAIEQNGGKCTNTVTSKTTFLLIGVNPGASKYNKANELNIDIKTEQEFMEITKTERLNKKNNEKENKDKQLKLFD